jgi:hypothetical protein
MYGKILATALLFSISLLPKATSPAHALGCVNVDVSNQVKITGSKDAPGTQQNNVHQAIDPETCVGNVNVGKSNQVYVGTDGADQVRNSSQSSGGIGTHPAIPKSVMDAGNVNFQSGTATTIYNPALDPNFLPKK